MAAPTPSKLDQQQILQAVHNETDGTLRVDATLVASIIEPDGLEVSISATSDNIAIRNSNNSNELEVNSDGSINTRGVQLFTLPFDAITATYPSSTSEVYQSRVGGIGGSVQQTLTLNYVDSTKARLLNAAVV